MQLTNAKSEHFTRILSLNSQAVPAVNEISLAELEALARQALYFKVAIADQVVMGFLLVLPEGEDYASLNYQWFSKKYEHFSYIDRIVVSPKAKGQGIGKALYQDLIESHSERQRICCEVNIKPMNTDSLAFHDKIGFREVGQQDTEGGLKRVSLMSLNI